MKFNLTCDCPVKCCNSRSILSACRGPVKGLLMMRPRFMAASMMYANGWAGCGFVSQDRILNRKPITLNENISSTYPCILRSPSCRTILFTLRAVAYTGEIPIERGLVAFDVGRITGERLSVLKTAFQGAPPVDQVTKLLVPLH